MLDPDPDAAPESDPAPPPVACPAMGLIWMLFGWTLFIFLALLGTWLIFG